VADQRLREERSQRQCQGGRRSDVRAGEPAANATEAARAAGPHRLGLARLPEGAEEVPQRPEVGRQQRLGLRLGHNSRLCSTASPPQIRRGAAGRGQRLVAATGLTSMTV